MAEFWTSFLFPLIIMVAQSVLLLVILLVAIAYILYADRKIWPQSRSGAVRTWSAPGASCNRSPIF